MLKIIGLALLAAFYAVYVGKMLLQRRKGIRTDQLGKSMGKARRVERLTKLVTYCVLAVEVASILLCDRLLWKMPLWVQAIGVSLGLSGVVIFATAVVTMRDSWRAGIFSLPSSATPTSSIAAKCAATSGAGSARRARGGSRSSRGW